MNTRNILIIGSGGMGRRHLKAFSGIPGVRLHCYDVDASRLTAIESDFPGTRCHANLDGLGGAGLDGAVIVSPTDTHIGYAEWCIGKRLPFLVEKPISNRLEGVREVIAKAAALGLPAGVAFPRRNSRAVARLKELVASGFIGDVKVVNSAFSQDFRKYRPDYQSTYYAKLSTGGGLLMDALSHHVDLAAYFAGPVRAVACLSERLEFQGCEGEDTAMLSLRFRNGMLGNIVGNQFQKPNEDRIELVGTRGNLRYERISGILSWNQSDDPSWHQESLDGNWDDIIRAQAESFLAASGGRPGAAMKTSLEEGLHSLQVVLAARESGRTGRLVEICIP